MNSVEVIHDALNKEIARVREEGKDEGLAELLHAKLTLEQLNRDAQRYRKLRAAPWTSDTKIMRQTGRDTHEHVHGSQADYIVDRMMR